jgi:polar amino acid transport system permease protein
VLAFTGALILYFLIAQVLIFGVRLLERRANLRLGRTPPSGTGLRGLLRHPALTTSTTGGAK